ncbi:hypothetical protein [Paludisphaera mucosa]|uniref:Uncharacterized protein n=1 Tax=Paludisphaera mucosa TaxID=3030827 RepID=A0ABT6FAC1_9BACT|nr:hypothetical protein [Paludisphaera mucosa]MDG3004505.1 hypothetical protein [Paludisphaera mucosa]
MARFRSRRRWAAKRLVLGAMLATAGGCSTVPRSWMVPTSLARPDAQPSLLRVEQMIDDLDRSMTQQGTIGVKSPDVWGQDRLAKFRSEYELQMAQWLKVGFKGVINASINRNEAKAQRLQAAAGLGDPKAPAGAATSTTTTTTTDEDQTKALLALIAAQNATSSTAAAATAAAAKAGASPVTADPSAGGMLEPTVVLDEHSHYLNHLNQLRRINAGDDLTDRPGYGLYLVRIPVTLSPGPKNRRGRGASITVSAKSLMDRDTMRYTLRNAVINEAVGSLTQAICNEPGKDDDPSPGPGLGPLSLVAYADSEVFYGVDNIAFLRKESQRQLSRELSDEPYHRGARIADWLRGEFEASYALLEQAAAPAASGQAAATGQGQGQNQAASEVDPLESLGTMIARRDFPKLAAMRPRADDSSVMLASGANDPPDEAASNRRRTLDALGFVLRIQAAALNARLKQDIVDQVPEIRREDLRHVNFFRADSSDEAFAVFQKYTNVKWPLRVYAIEPVIAQQNVADSVARRSTSGLDLIGGVPLGPFRAAGVFSNEAALAEEEAAIRLNPTMVGFGAGESTFGWIFYPRLQTARTGLSGLASVSHMVQAGLGREDKVQSIEPGQRECTALIVMPNFIPKIEFITVANWFKTSELNDGRTAVIEKASDLAARLVEAEKAINNVRSVDDNRPEELQIALERLNQLKSLMPTQRLVVRVPFSADNNDSRVFCSRGGQLRPALLAWHGKPPEPGEESTIFLEGKNFSVHDTHVIAGGKTAESVLVSRNLMQVTIAKDARPTPNDQGVPLLEISVATPNGASNHLLIRMRPQAAEPSKVPPPPAPAPRTAAVEVGPPQLEAPRAVAAADPEVHRASEAKPPSQPAAPPK